MLTIEGKLIGDGEPTYIVFEAGPTHNGLDTAKTLVTIAARAGADAVKFQILDPDRLVPDRNQMIEYDILVDKAGNRSETVSESLYEVLKRRYMKPEEWLELKSHCVQENIAFFSTATYIDELELMQGMNCDTVKICSGDVDHLPFIKRCAETGMCIQLDTGNATLGDIERAVDAILEQGNDRILIHNCPSGYPARLESINLRIIPTLKQMFGFPVAFSDHTPGWEMDIAAVALGANMVEKTITLDRTLRSPEHMFSLEPAEMETFVQSIRNLETALGNTRRKMTPGERKKSLAVRRSIVLSRNVREGEVVEAGMLDFARPGYGLRPERYEEVIGRRFCRDLAAGTRLLLEDLK